MALLDELVSQIPDVKLRGRLQQAVKDLKRNRRFGLLFEEHVPETTAIYGAELSEGVMVQRRDEPDAPLMRVQRLTNKGATAQLTTADGGEVSAAVKDLLLVKRFGEPMYAALEPLDTLERGGAERPYHAVINGENFHALQLMTYIYEESVDCIYIDPPYNTGGARDWKYNNHYVDSNDAWRHSKWLAMMEKRLGLAKRLLKPDGVLVVMIDEHELHHLGMLIERLFPEYIQYMVSIVINARGSTGNRNFGAIDEQAIFVVPDLGYDIIQAREGFIPNFHPSGSEGPSEVELLLAKVAQHFPDLLDQLAERGEKLSADDQESWKELANIAPTLFEDDDLEGELVEATEGVPDEEDPAVYWRGAVRTGQGTSFRTQRKNQFYPLYIDPKKPDHIEVGQPLLETDEQGKLLDPSWEKVKGLTPIWPVDEEAAERVWCYKPERMKEEIARGNIKVGRFNPRRNTYAVNVRRVRRTSQRFREITIWWEKSYDAGSNGTNILKKLLGASGLFPFPKSVYSVRDVLATVVGSRKDALILDFFAGSGTTLHSTCLLNAIDGGQRRCVLVTNNEVDEETATRLARAGHFRGDPDYEAMGIFDRVTAPRVKAAISGHRASDGAAITGRYKWADKRPYAEGFDENVEFYNLRYLDPNEVDLGHQFDAIHPLLWLAAGGIGERQAEVSDKEFYIAAKSPFGVLFRPSRLSRFLVALEKRPDISHVWVVTDSAEAFAEACEALPGHVTFRSQLYRDYLRTFRVNGRITG